MLNPVFSVALLVLNWAIEKMNVYRNSRALPALCCVTGTHLACDPTWRDSAGAQHFLRKEFGFARVSDVSCELLSSKI